MNKHALEHSIDFIKSWLEFRYDRAEIPGYAVAAAYKGDVLMNEAYGYADLEKQVKLTPQHMFRIASHSKTFTSTAIMQLVELGKLRLEDYVVEYLPWLNEHNDKRWNKVTVRQLLSHSAGVIRDGLNADYWQLERPFPNEAELKEEVLEADLVIDSNTKLKYSNYGYSLLGMVIKHVSGQPYDEYVTEHIINQLGLTSTGPEYNADLNSKMVTGYSRREVNKTRLPLAPINTRAMAAATGFYSTAEDLCKYFTAQLVGSGKLLDDESKKEMQRTQWHAKLKGRGYHEDYGLGFEIFYPGRRRTIGHGGGFPGQITETMADPKDELVVAVLTNCIDGPARTIAEGVYEVIDYFQQNVLNDEPAHNLQRFEGRYMNLWSVANIIVAGEKIVTSYHDSWAPIGDPEELEYVNDTTLKVIDTGSFGSEDELVHFKFKEHKVESVNYNGMTMWPEKVWMAMQSDKKLVGDS